MLAGWIHIFVAVFFLIYWTSLWVVHLMALIYGKWKLHRKVDVPDTENETWEGVTIIKPLYQSQEILTENLETFFKLKYPKFEILFCIQEEEDKDTYLLVKQLIDLYPSVDTKVFKGGEEVGVNPKINNMTPAYRAAKYPLILVSDAGIKMKEDTLLDMVTCMKETVGLVHQMPFSCNRTGLPSILEKVYFGTSHARIYLSANLMGINCATGMSALMRKDLLDKAGGFPAFGCYLAEDFFFAKTVQEQGYYTVISTQPAQQNPGNSSITYFQNRISRWTKLRLAMCPYTTILEPISECMLAGGLAAWSAYVLLRFDPVVFYLVHVLCWFLSDWLMIHIVQNGALPFNKFEFLVMWLFREVSAPYIMMHAILNPAIRWRNLEFRLKWGGKAEAVNLKPFPVPSITCGDSDILVVKSDIDVIKCTPNISSSTKDETYLNSTGYRNSERYSSSSSKKGHSREHSLKNNSLDFNKDVYGDKISLLQNEVRSGHNQHKLNPITGKSVI